MNSSITRLEALLNQHSDNLDRAFYELMVELCAVLACDRCFLYLRNPNTGAGKITHCYSPDPTLPDLTGEAALEPADIDDQDPLMAIAFRTPAAVYVDDVETASPEIVNRAYEDEYFGHRALIHAPIYWQGQFYGVLEPCTFGRPKAWTEGDRTVTEWVQERLAPLVLLYAQQIGLV